MRYTFILLVFLICISDWANGQISNELVTTQPAPPAKVIPETEYAQIISNMFQRITNLKTNYPSLAAMPAPKDNELRYDYHVTRELDNPNAQYSKMNGTRATYEDDGYWFSLYFYRGKYEGQRDLVPIEFGGLQLFFEFGHGGDTSVIAAVTSIIREEHEGFCRAHPLQSPNKMHEDTAHKLADPQH